MPEPFSLTIIGATVVTVAYYIHKTTVNFINAPRGVINQGGKSAKEVIQSIGSEFRQTFFNAEPVITINRMVIQQAPQRICEICFAKQVVEVREQFEHSWLGSKKRLDLSQMFTLKAGFDLNRVRFEFHEDSKVVQLKITDATIVNVEFFKKYETRAEENGFWNRISTKEKNDLVNSLPEKAKQEAGKLGLTQLATDELKLILGAFFKRFGYSLEVKCENQNVLISNPGSLSEIPADKLQPLGIKVESVSKPQTN